MLSAKITFRRGTLPNNLFSTDGAAWLSFSPAECTTTANKNPNASTQCVDDYVAFAPNYLFVWIAPASWSSLSLGTGRLGIDHRGAGTGPTSGDYACGPSNPVAETLKQVQPPPFPEMIVHGLPGGIVRGEHSPLRTGLQHVENCVQQASRVVLVEAEPIKDRFDLFPFCVGQIRGILRHRSEAVL